MLKHFKKSVHLVVALICSITLFLAGAFIVPKPINAAADNADASFPKITFRNFEMSDGTYTQSDNSTASGVFTESLDQKFFVGNITLKDSYAKIYIGGTEAGKGLNFAISGQRLQAKWDDSSVKSFTRAKAGVSSFTNTEFTLGVSFQKVGTTLKVGVYFNGALYDGSYIDIPNTASKLGETVSLVCSNSTTSISIKSDDSAQILPNKQFDWITTDHFYIADGTYGYTETGAAVNGTYPLSLDKTYFVANVTFSSVEGASIRYGGQEKDGGLSGFMLALSGDNLVLSDALTGTASSVEFIAADAGLVSFKDTAFKLGISVEKIDADADGKVDDIQLGIWFNDTLYKNEYLNLVDYASKMGSTMGIVSTVEGSTVTIGKIAELSVTMPDPTLKKITAYEHFGMADKTYEGFNPSSEYKNGFDNTYFSAYLTYEGNARFYMYSDTSGWVAVSFEYSNNNLLIKTTGNGGLVATLTPDVAGVDFGKKFRIGIATTYIDADGDGNKNDIKMGVYFNEDLYNDQFFTIKDYLDGRCFNKITAYAPSSKLTIGSIAEFKDPVVSRPLDSSFKKITFETVAIDDGKYENNPDSPAALAAKGAYSKEFDGTAFGGTVKFSEKSGAQIGFGMDASGWVGFRCKISATGNFYIDDSAGIAPTMTFNAARAGLESFVETEFNLTLTTRYVDSDNDGEKDDIELGVWFNDVLYNDEFIYITDRVAKMGKVVAIYCPAETWVEVGTRAEFIPVVIPEELDKGYTLITLNDFGLPDTTYEKSGLVGNGKYLKTLDNTYFSYITNNMNDVVAVINYAGAGDAWTGMGITVADNQITVKDNSGRTDTYYFTAKRANIDSFTEKDIKLGVSTEYLDLDGDGAEDDVKFGIWVNDYLCNNEYIELIDYRQYIGNEEQGIGAGLGIYMKSLGEAGNGKLKVQSVKIPVNIERFGFTLNWARELALYANTTTTNPSTRPTQSPQTGEQARILKSMIISCVALGGIMNIDKKRR